jgi:hypothetical protein
MDNLRISRTKYTFEVNLDAKRGMMEMSGSSYPENAVDFFQPIFEWLEEYVSEAKKKLTMNARFDYLDTSSTKCVSDIFEILENYSKNGGDVRVNWYYDEDDGDILEMGKEFAEDIELPIHFIVYREG